MENIDEQIERLISDKNHYLIKAKLMCPAYFDGFKQAIESLNSLIGEKKLQKLLKDKFQIGQTGFHEKSFIQTACETTVNSYFARNFFDTFKYEEKLNSSNNMDVDCSFSDVEFKYNIEVKCPDFENKESVEKKHAFKLGTAGRIPDRDQEFNQLSRIFEIGLERLKDDNLPKDVVKQKNMDNNLKDFLISAHKKFSQNSSDQEVNILVVCCGDPQDIQSWFCNLYTNGGLFTPTSFHTPSDYNGVDLVVFSNLYHRHHKFYENHKIGNHWLLERAFNLIFSNPSRILDKGDAIKRFIELLPNHSNALMKYEVPGDAPQYIKDELRIRYFVMEELENKGIHLF